MEFSYTYEEFEYPNLERVLRELGERMRDYMREKLDKNGTNASHGLHDSIQYLIQKNGQDYEVDISLEEYWKWVENGTNAHWPPRDSIRQWILVKPVLPEQRNGKLPTVDQLAFLISRAMAGKSPNQANLKNPEGGTQAQPFFWNSVEEAVAEFEDRVGEAIAKDIDQNVETMLMKILL